MTAVRDDLIVDLVTELSHQMDAEPEVHAQNAIELADTLLSRYRLVPLKPIDVRDFAVGGGPVDADAIRAAGYAAASYSEVGEVGGAADGQASEPQAIGMRDPAEAASRRVEANTTFRQSVVRMMLDRLTPLLGQQVAIRYDSAELGGHGTQRGLLRGIRWHISPAEPYVELDVEKRSVTTSWWCSLGDVSDCQVVSV